MPVDPNALCMSFLLFLNQLGMYDAVENCPGVRMVPVEDLQAIACEGGGCPIQAFYERDQKIIYMSNELELEHPFHRSIMLHELVHYVQDVTGQWMPEDTDCHSGMSRELHAFRAQELYLLENDIHIPVSQQMAFYRC